MKRDVLALWCSICNERLIQIKMKTTATKNRVEILKGDLIRFKINEREVIWSIDNFSNKNGLLIFDFFGIKSIKPGEYEVIRNGSVINN